MKAEIGSVSTGTMRLQDLIPTFLSTLKNLDPLPDENLQEAYTELAKKISLGLAATEYFGEDYYGDCYAPYDLEELFDALNEHSPEGCYFGSHPGDGADYGWWSYGEPDRSIATQKERERQQRAFRQERI